jgi:hypothetical protein
MQRKSNKWNASDAEAASGRRMRRHLTIGFGALWITFVLSCSVLASGKYLSQQINIDQNSTLFWLWPFNRIYLQQFIVSPYHSSEIKWFFTVVSCSNFVWLIFFFWKFVFELRRKDVQFPPGRNSVIEQFIIRPLVVACVLLIVLVLESLSGFNPRQVSFFALSFEQSITVGAIKVILVQMFFLYFFAGIILEFGGLGLRYLLSKTFGYFAAETDDRQNLER